MTDTAFDPAAIAADAVALAELDGGTGREQVRVDWLRRRLHQAPGSRRVDGAGNLAWTFGPPPYRFEHGFIEQGLAGAALPGPLPLAIVFTDAVGSVRVRLTVTGPGGHSWWDRGERIRTASIVTGARQLRAVLQEALELTPRAARN